MKRYSAIAAAVLAFTFVLFSGANTVTAKAASDCDCPKDEPSTHGKSEILIDRELSPAEKIPTSGSLGFPKSLTVCMFYDQTNKGYPRDTNLIAEGSTDGRTWFPLTLVGTAKQASASNACLQVAPTRYVRVGWPPAANLPSPGPHVTVQVQAGYWTFWE